MVFDSFEKLQQEVERVGVVVTTEQERFHVYNEDFVYPFCIVVFCHHGSAQVLYDKVEMQQHKNELVVVMPGHMVRQLDCTDDFVFTRVAISKELLSDLQPLIYESGFDKFHLLPVCSLTDEQAQNMLSFGSLLNAVARHDYQDLAQRKQMLLSLLSVAYKFLNYYRREMDQQLPLDKNTQLYNRFCALVIEHYRESKEVKFYADLLHISPRHFSRIFQEITKGMTPAEWIEQYVITQAKLLIETQRDNTIQQISYQLGFPEPSSFHHFFKRVAGMTAKEYRASLGKDA